MAWSSAADVGLWVLALAVLGYLIRPACRRAVERWNSTAAQLVDVLWDRLLFRGGLLLHQLGRVTRRTRLVQPRHVSWLIDRCDRHLIHDQSDDPPPSALTRRLNRRTQRISART